MTATPQDFDLDAWLDDAERPQRAVTVYQKAGLIAELDVLAERISHADADDEVDGPSMGGGVGRLRAQYAELAQQFHDSALTIKVQALDEREKRELITAHPGITPTEAGFLVLSEAIVQPKITPEQLKKMEKRLGEMQFARILTAFHEACTEAPAVSADFLPKSSGQESSDG